MKNLYNEDYFERGIISGLSCYENYRWMGDETLSMCKSIINFADISSTDKILDFGCAKGFLVKAFNELNFDCYGIDISEYAIASCDLSVRDKVELFVPNKGISGNFDVIVSKDVLEHIPYDEIKNLVKTFRDHSKKIVIVVPLAKNNKYVASEYEFDKTHIIREDIEWWNNMLTECGFKNIISKFKVDGIKDNWSHYEEANGFFVCT